MSTSECRTKDPSTCPHHADISKMTVWQVRDLAADNDTPASQIGRIYEKFGDDRGVALNIAEHPSTPPRVLAKLARSSEYAVQLSAARNPGTPASALAILARHAEDAVRVNVAANRSTPMDALADLVADRNGQVWMNAQAHPEYENAVYELARRKGIEAPERLPADMLAELLRSRGRALRV